MKLGSTCLYVDDVPGVLDFYKRAFDLETKFVDLDVQLPGKDPSQSYQFAELGTEGGPLHVASHALGALMLPGYERPPDGQPAGVEIAFLVSDVPQAFDRAVRAGATALAEPKVMPWGQTVAYVRSIEGTCIGLCEPMDPGS